MSGERSLHFVRDDGVVISLECVEDCFATRSDPLMWYSIGIASQIFGNHASGYFNIQNSSVRYSTFSILEINSLSPYGISPPPASYNKLQTLIV